ncbi:MAG: N-formylglutamate deformylase [Pseudomonadota bacterium]
MTPVEVKEGSGPLILSQPHGGTFIPEEVLKRLNARGRALADTDWHIGRLYDGLVSEATVVRATFSRYVIDANRPPGGESLYPGQATTGLCPATDFTGAPIYQKGGAPKEDEVEARRRAFHAPYHAAIGAQIARLKARHGVVLLYDCHSIRSALPYLFEGRLPVFNIGTYDGRACAPQLGAAARAICRATEGYDHVLDGRFKGGWTIRHYGAPQDGVHAIQMELAQRAYMEETPPYAYRADLAARLRPHLKALLEALVACTLNLAPRSKDLKRAKP